MADDAEKNEMADDAEKKQSWWLTLPGILTAIGTFIGAITGLVAVLNQVGVFRTPVSPTTNGQLPLPRHIGPSSPSHNSQFAANRGTPDRPACRGRGLAGVPAARLCPLPGRRRRGRDRRDQPIQTGRLPEGCHSLVLPGHGQQRRRNPTGRSAGAPLVTRLRRHQPDGRHRISDSTGQPDHFDARQGPVV